jgi:hypothetical protein
VEESTKKFAGFWGPTARGEGRVGNQETPMLVEGVGESQPRNYPPCGAPLPGVRGGWSAKKSPYL